MPQQCSAACCWKIAAIAAALLPGAAADAAETSQAGSTEAAPAGQAAVFPVRELYAPGHFGNSYEVLGDNEMRAILEEAAHWGFNRYGDWFDMDDCKNLFSGQHTYGLGDAFWDHKTTHYASAQSLGLLRDLVATPNHVFIDQCRPDLLATKGPRVFGQLVCPSKPEARALILEDYDNIFRDLARRGVSLSVLNTCPYDFGGCRCRECDPWILTYAALAHEIYQAAQRHHPKIRMEMIGWWWSPEEHRMFAEWVDKNAPGWLDRMFLHIPYGAEEVADVPLPKGCERCAFVHIGFAEEASPRDMYGHLGPVIAARRIERTVARLKHEGATGVMAYSEGVFDDVNKAILAGLSSGRFRTADEVLEAYARRYFGVDEETAAGWGRWLAAWGKPFAVDARRSGEELAALLAKTPEDNWRRRQWELKQQLFEIHGRIGPGDRWTPERLKLVEQFWAVQEKLQRGVWGLAPQRHVFARRYTPLPWYGSWAKHVAAEASAISAEQ